MLQCLMAVTMSKALVQRTGMLVVVIVLAFITVFAVLGIPKTKRVTKKVRL